MKDIFGAHHGLDERSMDSLVGALERENLPGFDYIEFKQALERLQEMGMDEETSFKSAYATASTMGLTKDKLLKTAQHYKGILDKEAQNFDRALQNQVKLKVEGKRKEVQNLRKKVVEYEAKIKQLEELRTKAQQTIDEADAKIAEAQQGIDDVHDRFEATLRAIQNQIDRDLEDINRFL